MKYMESGLAPDSFFLEKETGNKQSPGGWCLSAPGSSLGPVGATLAWIWSSAGDNTFDSAVTCESIRAGMNYRFMSPLMAATRDLALDMDSVRIYSFQRLERHSVQGCD
jgi:hypothetical protein